MRYFWIILGLIVLVAIIYFLSRSSYGTMSTKNITPTPVTSETSIPGNISVSIANFAFNPSTLTVPALTEVTFINNDSTTHTITADDGSFDSGQIAPGKSYTHAFEQPGTFNYHCSIHTTMKGVVVVD